MALKNQYYSLQGNITLAEYDSSGVLGAPWNIGSVDAFEFTIEEDIVEERETISGRRAVAVTIPNGLDAKLNTTLKELSIENIQAVLRGKSVVNGASVVVDFVPSITFAQYTAGQRDILLNDLKLSSIVVTGADASNVVVNTSRADFGVIVLPEGMVTAQFPLAVDYNSGSTTSMGFLTQEAKTYHVRFEGVNTVVGGAQSKVLVEFYRVNITPAQSLELLAAEAAVTKVDIEATVLIDSTKLPSNEFGQFGNLVLI